MTKTLSRKNTGIKQRPRRRFGFGKVLLAIAFTISVTAGIMLARLAPLTSFDWGGLIRGRSLQEIVVEGLGRKLSQPYQILIMGIDRVPDAKPNSPEAFNGRSDTMLLVRFDPTSRSLRLLSIPRDTQVQIPQYGVEKINAANVFGGSNLAIATVKENLYNVKIDRYARVDTSGLVALIDALGGVEVNVPKRMRYEDKTQKLSIDLQPGVQTLNGKQAEGFARFRHDEEGDIGRIKRQQILLKAIEKKLSDPWLVFRLPQLADTMRQYIDTDLNTDEIIALSTFSLTLKPNSIKTLTLPGRPSADYEFNTSYWIADPDDSVRIINSNFQIAN
ncbi:LCP family protein [Pseudanabaena sp. PCC 6802]|uniref:LCP family protein n=1 Tax=Pseudanabaena sp. PCC 6802 TaxID=118173 RepID=UPI00037CED05|nr:LCP family protein [Pseudanabaena sp. PCC 6802]